MALQTLKGTKVGSRVESGEQLYMSSGTYFNMRANRPKNNIAKKIKVEIVETNQSTRGKIHDRKQENPVKLSHFYKFYN